MKLKLVVFVSLLTMSLTASVQASNNEELIDTQKNAKALVKNFNKLESLHNSTENDVYDALDIIIKHNPTNFKLRTFVNQALQSENPRNVYTKYLKKHLEKIAK